MKNDFVRTVLQVMGVPEEAFSVADPMALLLLFFFSTEAIVLGISVIIWLFVLLFGSGKHGDRSNKKDISNMSYKKEPAWDSINATSANADDIKHRYDDNSMKQMFDMDKKPGILTIIIKGFVVPVLIIFTVIYVAMRFINA